MSEPNESPDPNPKIIVDEGWKEQVQAEKDALQQKQSEQPNGDQPAQSETQGSSGEPSTEVPPPRLPPADFAGLLTLLATQASMSLSPSQNEAGEEVPPVLEVGKHYIDLIGVLEEKTRGNLDEAEAKMISSVLHELRMAFIAMQSTQQESG